MAPGSLWAFDRVQCLGVHQFVWDLPIILCHSPQSQLVRYFLGRVVTDFLCLLPGDLLGPSDGRWLPPPDPDGRTLPASLGYLHDLNILRLLAFDPGPGRVPGHWRWAGVLSDCGCDVDLFHPEAYHGYFDIGQWCGHGRVGLSSHCAEPSVPSWLWVDCTGHGICPAVQFNRCFAVGTAAIAAAEDRAVY